MVDIGGGSIGGSPPPPYDFCHHYIVLFLTLSIYIGKRYIKSYNFDNFLLNIILKQRRILRQLVLLTKSIIISIWAILHVHRNVKLNIDNSINIFSKMKNHNRNFISLFLSFSLFLFQCFF